MAIHRASRCLIILSDFVEFDAFYHVNLAKRVVEELLKLNVQAILTTHDMTIMFKISYSPNLK